MSIDTLENYFCKINSYHLGEITSLFKKLSFIGEFHQC